ncbi:MAG: MarR family winged helix-turn-helix transcriptional regulator [Cetobacterium sp.]
MKMMIRILMIVNEQPGIYLNELCEEFKVGKSSISIYISLLCERGLIEKKYNISDKKRFRVHPTKKGKDIYLEEKISEMHRKKLERRSTK